MSVLKKVVQWFEGGQASAATILTDVISIVVRKGLDAKGNTVEILLKNPITSFDGTNNIHKYVSADSNTLTIQKDDIIKVFVKQSDDQTEIDTTSSTDLLSVCDIVDIEVILDGKKSRIKLTCIDKTFNILNQVFAQNYGSTDAKTAPQIIKELIRNVCETTTPSGYEQDSDGVTGTFFETNAVYEVDARLESEGGEIQDTRPDSSVYPPVSIAKLYKPVYEWIEELSQTSFTNTSSEKNDGTEVCQLKHVYYVDENNVFHWFYPDDTIDYTITPQDSADGSLRSLKLKRSVFDVVNCIFYSAGRGLVNETMLGLYFDATSDEPKLKQKYIPYENISIEMKNAEIDNGNITIEADGTTTFNVSSGTTAWGESFSSTADFTTKFFNEGIKRAEDNAQRFTAKRGSARWKGSGTFVGTKYIAGKLMDITAIPVGVKNINDTVFQYDIDKEKTPPANP